VEVGACSGQLTGEDVNPAEEVFASSFCPVNKQPQIGLNSSCIWVKVSVQMFMLKEVCV